MSISKIAYTLISFLAAIIILSYGKNLIMPFILALFIWLLIKEIKKAMNKIGFVRRKFPSWLLSVIASVFMFLVLGFVTELLVYNIKALSHSSASYAANLDKMANMINDTFDINLRSLLGDYATDLDFAFILSTVVNSLTDILGNAFLIALYVLFLLIEESIFSAKLKAIFPESDRFERVDGIVRKIENAVTDYIGLKTLVSLITGVLSYIVLLILGIDSPVFWAFLIFLLNFIPTIGSLIATLFPAIYALLQFGELTPFVLVLSLVGLVQIIVGNILEPKIMGNALNISSLVAILSLSFWGWLWGITGMILSIPITVMIVIVFAQFPGTRPIAILLSGKGKADS
ncbi:MAG TPA: AI-2E family transporter [Flavobacteriales bacterium]|nr:AI-2E family transporter [Flavobacteriales bacterium]